MGAPKTNGLWMLLFGLGCLLFVPYAVRQIRDPGKRWWQKIDRLTIGAFLGPVFIVLGVIVLCLGR